NVVTSTLVCEGPGEWNEYVGGYADWLRQRKPEVVAAVARPSAARAAGVRPRRMGFKEKRELDDLPGRIGALEEEKQRLYELMALPTFYASRGDEIAGVKSQLAAIETELQAAYSRWVELETLATGGE